MFKIIDNFLTNRQSDYLRKKVSGNYISYINDTYNFEGEELLIAHEKWLQDKLIEHNIINSINQIEIIRIQRIKEGFKVIDEFHTHTIDRSFVCILNDDFIGGEFVYVDDENNEVSCSPARNTLMIFSGDVPHKVNKVSSGERLTLVCFYRSK